MTGTILGTILGLNGPEDLALEIGAAVVNELLRHPQADTAAPVQVLSDTPGRIRLRLSGIKGAPEVAARAEKRLACQSGVGRVTASPVTGTVLLNYDPKATTAKSLQRAAEYAIAATRVVRADKDFQLPRFEGAPA